MPGNSVAQRGTMAGVDGGVAYSGEGGSSYGPGALGKTAAGNGIAAAANTGGGGGGYGGGNSNVGGNGGSGYAVIWAYY